MNVAYNTALRQSKAIRSELSNLDGKGQLTPAEIGNVSVSLSSFTKSLDDYQNLARQEIVSTKQEEAFGRVRKFRDELSEFRSQLDGLKKAQDQAQHSHNRSELLGRRPYNATPENPYASVQTPSSHPSSYQPRHHGPSTSTSTSTPSAQYDGGPPQPLTTGAGDEAREAHAFREQNFFANTHYALDDYIARGQAVLGDLGQQREMLKSTQKKLYSVGNTLGISGDTIRMVERRAKEDKWIFVAGVLVFFLFCWLVLHFLR